MRENESTRRRVNIVEVTVVGLVLWVLGSMAAPKMSHSQTEKAKARTCETNIEIITRQVEYYKHDTGEWPQDLHDVANNPNYFPNGLPECPFAQTYHLPADTPTVEPHVH